VPSPVDGPRDLRQPADSPQDGRTRPTLPNARGAGQSRSPCVRAGRGVGGGVASMSDPGHRPGADGGTGRSPA
jgi:hypothetical protein